MEDINIGEITEALNNKADLDLVNAVEGAAPQSKAAIAGWMMPSGIFINIPVNASGTKYTAPADGYIAVAIAATVAGNFFNCFVTINGVLIYEVTLHSTSVGYNQGDLIPIPKGAKVEFVYNEGNTFQFCRFIYANGTNPNA